MATKYMYSVLILIHTILKTLIARTWIVLKNTNLKVEVKERKVKTKPGTSDDPRFRFLFETGSNDHRFYLLKLQQTRPDLLLPIEVSKIMVPLNKGKATTTSSLSSVASAVNPSNAAVAIAACRNRSDHHDNDRPRRCSGKIS